MSPNLHQFDKIFVSQNVVEMLYARNCISVLGKTQTKTFT
jgi:hypothetical protein